MAAQSRRNVKVASVRAFHWHETGERRRWSDTLTFVLAVAGASIGFKTIWQLPYIVSNNGGGAFILIYLLLAFTVGAPLLMAQAMLGRRAHASPVKAMSELGAGVLGRRHWAIVGGLVVFGGFVVFSYLSVIAGWMIAYFVRALFGLFAGLTADGVNSLFAAFVKDPEKQVFWHSLFAAAAAVTTAAGIRHGLELTARWLVPTLYVLLLVLAAYVLQVGALADAVAYFFTPDFAKLTPSTWLIALAQVFFSLSLGTGVTLMYGAYLKADASIPRAALTIVGLDVLTGVIAGVVVFAVLFGGGIAPTSGPALVFQALPLAFDHLPLGRWFVCLFFALLVVIALLMGISLLEPVVVWLGERFGWPRMQAALVSGVAAWALGLVSIFSFNYAAFSFKFFGIEKNLGVFDILQTATAEIVLPLAAFCIAVFAGWLLSVEKAHAELGFRSPCAFDAWLWLLRIAVPPALVLLLVTLYRL